MRHRVSGYKLGRKTGSRKALYRILVNECIKRGKIRTTMAKAKAVQPKIEKLITLGRKGSLNDRKKAYAFVNNIEITKLSATKFRVFIGPFDDLNSLKEQFNAINTLQFENIEIIKK